MKGIIIGMVILLWAVNVYSCDVAVKAGYIMYENERDSEYIGNTCYDSEMSYGGFVRMIRDGWVIRFDMDSNGTGNTFLNELPYPYEQVRVTQSHYVLSAGYMYKGWLYGLVGAGISVNEGDIEQYPSEPFSYGFKDNICYGWTVGVEKVFEPVFVFMEYRYLIDEMEIRIGDRSISEDVSNAVVYTGVGVRF